MYHRLIISLLLVSGGLSTGQDSETPETSSEEMTTEFVQKTSASYSNTGWGSPGIGSRSSEKEKRPNVTAGDHNETSTAKTTAAPSVSVPSCSTTQLVAEPISVDYAWTLTGILSYVHLLGPTLSRNDAKLLFSTTELKFEAEVKNIEFSGNWSATFTRCPRYGDVKIELTYTAQEKADYYITGAEILVIDANGRRHQRSADIVTRQYGDESASDQGMVDVTKLSWDFHSSYLNEHVSNYKRRSKRGATAAGTPVVDQLDLVFNIGVVEDVPIRSQFSSHCTQDNIESELMKMEKRRVETPAVDPHTEQ